MSRLPDILENNVSSERIYPGLEVDFSLERINLDELNVLNELYVKNVATFQRLQHFIKRNGHQLVNDKVVIKDKLVYKKDNVNACELCLKIKTPQPLKHDLLSPIATERPFQILGVDIAYLPISNGCFRYALVAIDYFTNWVDAALLKTMSA